MLSYIFRIIRQTVSLIPPLHFGSFFTAGNLLVLIIFFRPRSGGSSVVAVRSGRRLFVALHQLDFHRKIPFCDGFYGGAVRA